MGWACRGGGLDPVLEEAAYNANIGDVFRVETAKGVHLVQVTAEWWVAPCLIVDVSVATEHP